MQEPPEGYEVVVDVNERLQVGDMLYDPEDEEWICIRPKQAGCYVPEGHTLSRLVPLRAVKRIMRSRKPK